jgi:hypothetical protein
LPATTPPKAPRRPAHTRYNQLFDELITRRGGDANIGLKLPVLLRQAGLGGVGLRIVQPAFITGPVKHVHAVTLTSISESLVAEGMVSAQDARTLHAELVARVFAVGARTTTTGGSSECSGSAATRTPSPPTRADPLRLDDVQGGRCPTMGMMGAREDATRESYDRVADDYAATFFADLDGKPQDRALLRILAEQAPDSSRSPTSAAAPATSPGWDRGRLHGLPPRPSRQ